MVTLPQHHHRHHRLQCELKCKRSDNPQHSISNLNWIGCDISTLLLSFTVKTKSIFYCIKMSLDSRWCFLMGALCCVDVRCAVCLCIGLCVHSTRALSIDLLAWLGDKITVSNDLIISLEIIDANGLYSWFSIKRAIKPQNAWQMSASGFIVPHCYACMCTLCILHA